LGAFKLRVAEGRVTDARIAFGGMAGTPKRAPAAETALRGAAIADPAVVDVACAALGKEFAPIDDLRASARYRMHVAEGLLRKAMVEIAGAPSRSTRVVGWRDGDDPGR
jgi:xanthine dehydrogenase small subunit